MVGALFGAVRSIDGTLRSAGGGVPRYPDSRSQLLSRVATGARSSGDARYSWRGARASFAGPVFGLEIGCEGALNVRAGALSKRDPDDCGIDEGALDVDGDALDPEDRLDPCRWTNARAGNARPIETKTKTIDGRIRADHIMDHLRRDGVARLAQKRCRYRSSRKAIARRVCETSLVTLGLPRRHFALDRQSSETTGMTINIGPPRNCSRSNRT